MFQNYTFINCVNIHFCCNKLDTNFVNEPARTGNDRRSRIAVMKTAQTNSGIWSIVIPKDRILITVVIKFTAPKIEDTPTR